MLFVLEYLFVVEYKLTLFMYESVVLGTSLIDPPPKVISFGTTTLSLTHVHVSTPAPRWFDTATPRGRV